MTPKKINELLGQKIMGWTLRRSKNPYYDWWVDAYGHHAGLARNFNPIGHCYGNGVEDCIRIINKLITDGFRNFTLKQVYCVEGFTWAASIKGRVDQLTNMRMFYGGAGETMEKAICSMAVKIAEAGRPHV